MSWAWWPVVQGTPAVSSVRYLQSSNRQYRCRSEKQIRISHRACNSWRWAPAGVPDGAAMPQCGTMLTFKIKLGVQSHFKGMCVYISWELQEYLIAECAELLGFTKWYQLTEQIINGTDAGRGRDVWKAHQDIHPPSSSHIPSLCLTSMFPSSFVIHCNSSQSLLCFWVCKSVCLSRAVSNVFNQLHSFTPVRRAD